MSMLPADGFEAGSATVRQAVAHARAVGERPANPRSANEGGWSEFEPIARLVSATIVIGALSGAVIGGLGGRLAMRILFVTSDEAVKGLTSDDGFEIGRFSMADTLGLVVFTAVLGALAALLYLVAHPFVVPFGRAVTPVMAVFYGVVGGALIVRTDGVDFTLLEPAALAIVMFVALCAGYGAVVAHLVNGAASPGARAQARRWWFAGPPLLALVLPPLLILAVLVVFVNRSRTNAPDGRRWRLLRAGALMVMSAVLVFSALKLARDTAALT
jgi:hypothetical protein